MVTYCYSCESCHATSEARAPMGKAPEGIACACGGTMTRDFRAELGRPSGELPDWQSLLALRCLRSDIPFMQRQFAHLDVTWDDRGVPTVPGRNRRKFIAERGFQELH